tara:strand:+ start:2988 stop:3980 length:993 start_codon:yes stop_codon:yes gene_type:complete
MDNNVEEIDLVEVLRKIWSSRKLIFIISSLFVITGVTISLLSPVIYNSQTKFIPVENSKSSNGALSNVASLVGINLGVDSPGSITPSMYPQVSESIEFKRLLLDELLDVDKKLKIKDFLMDYYKIPTGSYIRTNNSSFVSLGENDLFKILSLIITINVDKKSGLVSISTKMPSAEYSASICLSARNILQNIIINKKIKSAKQNLEFSQKQLELKRVEFEEIQTKLASFNDSNLNLVNSSIINKGKKLEAEFDIINAVMIELSKQVEQNKLQVSKDTPVFSVIQDPVMPVHRSSPKRTQMVLIYCFIGFIISVFIALLKDPFVKITKKIIS